MKHICGLVSTAQALRWTFLTPLETTRAQFLRYNIRQTRPQSRGLKWNRPSTAPPSTPKQITDEDIPSDMVRVVNEEGNLDPPVRLRELLRSLNRSDEFVLQVQPGTPELPPVCKIMNKHAIRENERAKAKAALAAKVALKQVEINWAIDGHDLSHRLKQLTGFLEKGRKVEIILKRKRGKRAPTAEEVKHVMDSVMETTKQANAMLVKPIEGEPGKQVLITVKKKDS